MRFPLFKKREGGAMRTKDGGLRAWLPQGQGRKGKHKQSTRETETKSSPCMETCRTGKWGGICFSESDSLLHTQELIPVNYNFIKYKSFVLVNT